MHKREGAPKADSDRTALRRPIQSGLRWRQRVTWTKNFKLPALSDRRPIGDRTSAKMRPTKEARCARSGRRWPNRAAQSKFETASWSGAGSAFYARGAAGGMDTDV